MSNIEVPLEGSKSEKPDTPLLRYRLTIWADTVSHGIAETEILRYLIMRANLDIDNQDYLSCWPAIRTIATHTQRSTRTVRRALKRLEERGILVSKDRRRQNQSTYYTLRIPQRLPSQLTHKPQVKLQTTGHIADTGTTPHRTYRPVRAQTTGHIADTGTTEPREEPKKTKKISTGQNADAFVSGPMDAALRQTPTAAPDHNHTGSAQPSAAAPPHRRAPGVLDGGKCPMAQADLRRARAVLSDYGLSVPEHVLTVYVAYNWRRSLEAAANNPCDDTREQRRERVRGEVIEMRFWPPKDARWKASQGHAAARAKGIRENTRAMGYVRRYPHRTWNYLYCMPANPDLHGARVRERIEQIGRECDAEVKRLNGALPRQPQPAPGRAQT